MSNKRRIPVIFTIIIWLAFTVPIPFVNKIKPFIMGMPLLWFWEFIWVVLTPILLTISYFILKEAET